MSAVEINYLNTTAVVLGAGSGIGSATAHLLASRGARVACLDRDGEAAQSTVDSISSKGGDAISACTDITDRDSLEGAFRIVSNHWGQLHSVINCVGIQGQLGILSHEVSLADFDKVVAINLRGALSIGQVAISHMLPFRYGRIVHVSSIAGKEGNPNMIAYSTTKAGLIGMVKAQGKEYATSGITINALAPAVIQTPFLDTQPAEIIGYMTAKIPMARTGTIEEAAQLLCWMASPECSFTTGFTFDLSGGRATY